MSDAAVGPEVRLTIDLAQCQGHGRCYSLAPSLVEPDDDGYPLIRTEILSEPDDITSGEEIVSSCPEQAISLDP